MSNRLLDTSFLVNKKLQLKNRLVMLPMYIGLDLYDEKFQEFYIKRAMGGVSLVIVPIPTMGGIIDLCKPQFVPTSLRFIEECHKYGCKVIAQIFSGPGEQVNCMSIEELESITKDLTMAALKVKEAGYDGIEIHGAHHSLFMSLFSPLINQRNDEYGGSFENRTRLQLQTMKEIRLAVGESFPIFIRFSGSELVEGGVDLDSSSKYAKLLEQSGVDCLDISAGGTDSSKKNSECPDSSEKEGCFAYIFSSIKQAVDIPVIGAGNIIQRETADSILTEKKADLIGIGRPLIAQADWANIMLNHLDSEKKGLDKWYENLPN